MPFYEKNVWVIGLSKVEKCNVAEVSDPIPKFRDLIGIQKLSTKNQYSLSKLFIAESFCAMVNVLLYLYTPDSQSP